MIHFRQDASRREAAPLKSDRHVLLIASDAELISGVGAAIKRLGAFSLEIARRDTRRLPAGASGAAAVVVEVDGRSAGAPDAVQRIGRQAVGTPILVAARGASADIVRALFRAGATDVLTGPFDADSVRASLGDLLVSAVGTPVVRGGIISVLKGRGGAGATTLALNLAAALAAGDDKRGRGAKRAGVIDLDLQFGDTALQLDLQPRTTIVDLLRAKDRIDARLLEGLTTEHDSGLRLLAPPPGLTPLDAVSADFALETLDHAAVSFERTIVDLPADWTDWTVPVLARSDVILLVTTATVSGAAGAKRVLDGLKEAGVQTPVFLVLNMVDSVLDALDKASRIGRSLQTPVDATLPRDPSAAKAADRGQLVVQAFPNARLAKDLRSCAAKLDARLEALRALSGGAAA